jgi:hypothetical protein
MAAAAGGGRRMAVGPLRAPQKVAFSNPVHPCDGTSVKNSAGVPITIAHRDVLQAKVPVQNFLNKDRSGTIDDLRSDSRMDKMVRRIMFLLMWLTQQLTQNCKVNVFIERVLKKDAKWPLAKGANVHALSHNETAYNRYRVAFALRSESEDDGGSGGGDVSFKGCAEIGKCLRRMFDTLALVDEQRYSPLYAGGGASMTREQMEQKGGGGGNRRDPYQLKATRDAVRRSLPVQSSNELFELLSDYSSITTSPAYRRSLIDGSDDELGAFVANCLSIAKSISRSDSHALQCNASSKSFGIPDLVYGLGDIREFNPPHSNPEDPQAPSGFDRFHPWLHPPKIDRERLEAYLDEQKKVPIKTKYYFTQTWLVNLAKDPKMDITAEWLQDEIKKHEIVPYLLEDILIRRTLAEEVRGRKMNELPNAPMFQPAVEASFWLPPLTLYCTDEEYERLKDVDEMDEVDKTKKINTELLEKLHLIAVHQSRGADVGRVPVFRNEGGGGGAVDEDEDALRKKHVAAMLRIRDDYSETMAIKLQELYDSKPHATPDERRKVRDAVTKTFHDRLRDHQKAACRSTYTWFAFGNGRPPAIQAIAEYMDECQRDHKSSTPLHPLSPNLTPFSSLVASTAYLLEYTRNESTFHMKIPLLFFDFLTTYDVGSSGVPFQLRPNQWFEGEPSGGKSHLVDEAVDISIRGTVTQLQDFTEKSFKPDAESDGGTSNQYDRTVIVTDDMARKTFGDVSARTDAQSLHKFVTATESNVNSFGEAVQRANLSKHRTDSTPAPVTTMLQLAMTSGEISHQRTVKNLLTGKFAPQYSRIMLRMLFVGCGNFAITPFTAFSTRVQSQVIDPRRRPGNDPADKANNRTINPARLRMREVGRRRLRDIQALLALAFTCIGTDSILPINSTIADQLMAEFFKEAGLTSEVGGPTNRAQAHVRARMRVYCMIEAVLKVFFDPVIGLHCGTPFEPEQLVDLQPYLVISVDHFVFAMTAMMERFYHPLIPPVVAVLREHFYSNDDYKTDLKKRQDESKDGIDIYKKTELAKRFKGRYFSFHNNAAASDNDNTESKEKTVKSTIDKNRLSTDMFFNTDGMDKMSDLQLLALQLTDKINLLEGSEKVQTSDMVECLSQLTKMTVEDTCPLTKVKKTYPMLVVMRIAEKHTIDAQFRRHVLMHPKQFEEGLVVMKQDEKTNELTPQIGTGKASAYDVQMKRHRLLRIVTRKSILVARGNPFEDALHKVVSKAVDRPRDVMTGMCTGALPYIARMLKIKPSADAANHVMSVRNSDYMETDHHHILSVMTHGLKTEEEDMTCASSSSTDLPGFDIKGSVEKVTILERNQQLYITTDEDAARYAGRTSSDYLDLVDSKLWLAASSVPYPACLVPRTGPDGRTLMNMIEHEQKEGFVGLLGHGPFVSRDDEIPDAAKARAKNVVLDINKVQGARNLADVAFQHPEAGFESLDPTVRAIADIEKRIFVQSVPPAAAAPPPKTPRRPVRVVRDDEFAFSQVGVGDQEMATELQEHEQRRRDQLLLKRKREAEAKLKTKTKQTPSERKEQEDAEGPISKASAKSPSRKKKKQKTFQQQPLPDSYRVPEGMQSPPPSPPPAQDDIDMSQQIEDSIHDQEEQEAQRMEDE